MSEVGDACYHWMNTARSGMIDLQATLWSTRGSGYGQMLLLTKEFDISPHAGLQVYIKMTILRNCSSTITSGGVPENSPACWHALLYPISYYQ